MNETPTTTSHRKYKSRPLSQTSAVEMFLAKNEPVAENFQAQGNCSRYCYDRMQSLENTIKLNKREFENLEYMISFRDLAIKKRDDMIEKYVEENNRLKETIKKLEKYVQRLKSDTQENKQGSNVELPSFALRPHSTARGQKSSHSPFIRTNSSIMKLSKLNHKTVTETQGMPDNQSLLVNKDGRHSLLNDEGQALNKIPRLKNLEEFLKKHDDYTDALLKSPKSQQIEFFDTVASLLADFKNLTQLTLRLKKLIRSAQNISTSLILDDAFNSIIKETCENLSCDRATVFLCDFQNNELWSKVAKDSKTIRVPIDQGVAGYAATNNLSVKIDDAYSDPRFNKEVDSKSNYKTKSILCVPIKDFDEKVLGVLQAINKNNSCFTSDDEGLLGIIAGQAGSMLKNSLLYDKLVINQYKLIKLIEIGMSLFECLGLELVMIHSERKLKDIMMADKCVVYLVDRDGDRLLRYDVSTNYSVYKIDIGIIGEVVKTGLPIEVKEPYNHVSFNMMVDIDTNLPTLTIPVKSSADERVIAVFQVVNMRGVIGKGSKHSDMFDKEILKFFSKILAICIEKSYKMDKIIEDSVRQRQEKEKSKRNKKNRTASAFLSPISE